MLIYMGLLMLPETLEIALDPRVLWIIFALTMCVVAILSAVLIYHWITYSYAPKQSSLAITVFGVGLGVLILTAIVSLILFTSS